MDRWRVAPEMRMTLLLLAGGLTLIAAGTVGVSASLWLVVALVCLALLMAVLARFAADTAWKRVDPHAFLADVWVGPMLAAIVVGIYLGASPGEVQALGGLIGLLGMANYFLRPVYHLLYALGRRLANA